MNSNMTQRQDLYIKITYYIHIYLWYRLQSTLHNSRPTDVASKRKPMGIQMFFDKVEFPREGCFPHSQILGRYNASNLHKVINGSNTVNAREHNSPNFPVTPNCRLLRLGFPPLSFILGFCIGYCMVHYHNSRPHVLYDPNHIRQANTCYK